MQFAVRKGAKNPGFELPNRGAQCAEMEGDPPPTTTTREAAGFAQKQIWVGVCGVARADDGNPFGFELISAA